MNYTPGPWHVGKEQDGRAKVVYDSDGFEIAKVCYPRRDDNARLIAVAPEMLEALCNFVAWFNKTYPEPSTHPEHEWNIANRVIAKAMGEGPC